MAGNPCAGVLTLSPRVDHRLKITDALRAFAAKPVPDAAKELLQVLGYASKRTLPISSPGQFLKELDPDNRLTERDRDAFAEITALRLLFQFTDAELTAQKDLFDRGTGVETTQIQSYLFFAVELSKGHYTRSVMSTLLRAINKPLPMPAIVLFKHGVTVSMGIIHRRLNKRDRSRDVLEKVTLVKDIHYDDPIRAHVEILNDFASENLDADYGVGNFVQLHEAWQKRLGSYALSNEFYREIADWYFWAHHQVADQTIRLPKHCDTEQEQSLFLIRLLTRVIFCWFLVEKRLIPNELFRERWLRANLKKFSPGKITQTLDTSPTFYRAILQNLFFGTLNMPTENRAFREKKREGERYDKNYGITNLWRYEADFVDPSVWVSICERIPFLNGGLFDCLDDKIGHKDDNFLLDGFSDNPKLSCLLPNDLFFGSERTADLSKDYGEEGKKTARSKKAKVRGLIEILSRYKFTVEENTPLEEEIALDPELLGKVFENLLASYNEDTKTTARKALGAFYTPREIVSYMVDESLKSYLGTQVPRCKGALEDLFSNKATLKEIKPDTGDALIAAIGRVKILDPACGSGAFPMGALHRLVDLLQKLDPDNNKWRAIQRQRAIAETEEAFKSGDGESRQQRLKEINDTFEFNSSDYGRKLYLIENSIYGVDIQPIATQIAKLRFFIALVVEQKVTPEASNLGVLPLPNLETRIVAADTLIPIEKQEDGLFSGALNKLRQELSIIRHEHFNARSPQVKRKWREADAAKRAEISEMLEDDRMLDPDSARKLAAWNPYDQNTFAPFFDSSWMFGVAAGKVRARKVATTTLGSNNTLPNDSPSQNQIIEENTDQNDSGFDIVIGNPPYIRIQTLKQKDPKRVAFFKNHYASSAKGNYDIYVVFIEAGLRLLRSDGNLAYICPHKFFNADYGEPTRTLLSKGRHLRHVVHFGDQQIFFGATIYTCLLFLAKAGSEECRFVKAHDLESWMERLFGEEGRFPASGISGSDWNFTVGASATVFDDLQARPIRLGEIAARISQGIRTSANEVYVLEMRAEERGIVTAYSKELNAEVPLERKGVHLFLQGREIKPFSILASGKVVIIPYALDGRRMTLIPLSRLTSETPHVANYLKRNRTTLESREDGRMEGPLWYGYIYPKNLDVMLEPKLLVPDIADRACFALDEDGQYAFTSGYGITVKDPTKYPLKFILGLCNSRVLDFYWRRVSTPLRGGFFRYFTQFIEQLPVVDALPTQRDAVIRIVDFLIYLNRHFAAKPDAQTTRDPFMVAYWERILNGLVYELYFPNELHAAGVRIFDVLTKAKLHNVDQLADSIILPALRESFVELYDPSHPLRIALDKLQTLDTIRIIEGTV
jgi:adenine-specific DNA-methyltransferase